MKRRTFLLSLALFGGALLAAEAPGVAAAAEKERALVIVVNKENRVNRLSHADLRDIFLGKRRFWAEGGAIAPVDFAEKGASEETTAYARFGLDVLHKDLGSLKNYWIRMMFSGKGQPPKRLEKASAVIDYVAEREGAIAYIYADQVTDRVKTINLSGDGG
jgi:ABC-type phosphate transport system substrate-binding protein